MKSGFRHGLDCGVPFRFASRQGSGRDGGISAYRVRHSQINRRLTWVKTKPPAIARGRFSGGGGNRTRVPRHFRAGVYVCSPKMLAMRLAYEIDEVDPNLMLPLKSQADEDLYKAQAEERDNSPFNVMPQIGAYTR